MSDATKVFRAKALALDWLYDSLDSLKNDIDERYVEKQVYLDTNHREYGFFKSEYIDEFNFVSFYFQSFSENSQCVLNAVSSNPYYNSRLVVPLDMVIIK